MYIQTTGLVLRDTEYKETSRILTVLTSTEGKITVSAKGAKRKGSKIAASSQLLAYSEMTLFLSRDRYALTEARSIELFRGLRDDLNKLALGTYFAELLEALSDEDMPNPEMLSLGLNALYALSEGKNDDALIKAAFEMRLMCAAGYEPLTDCCAVCGKQEPEIPVLSLVGGVIHCMGCESPERGEELILSPGTLAAIRYIAHADPKKLYRFTMSEDGIKNLGKVTEAYLKAQLGRSFGTLDFYHSLI
jgi:DNA repair protein RecO (recombination protein O)